MTTRGYTLKVHSNLNPRQAKVLMEPLIGIEPTTYSLRVNVVDIHLRFIWC